MSTLKALLKDVPVEWKALEEISDLYNGLTGKNKSDFEDGNAKFVTYKNIYGHIEVNPNILESVKISPEERQNEVIYGDILFTGSSENTSDVGASCAVTIKPDFKLYLNSFSFGLRFKSNFKLIPEFSKYLFSSHVIREQIIKTASGVTRYNVSKKRFLKIQIPIPHPNDPKKSLAIQQEIVRVLDGLSEQNKALTTALTQEIDQRKKQYEFYETKLLFENGFETIPLSKLCIVNQGLQIPIEKRKNKDGQNRYSYITVQYLKDKTNPYYIENPPLSSICDYDDILVTRTGSTGKIITGVKGCFHNNFFKVDCFDNIIYKRFMYCILRSKVMFDKLVQAASGGTVPDLPHNKFYKLQIPVPSIQEQEHIVRLLDQFDEATKKIVAQLEKEIELRNKQYEYYRNELLAFRS